MAIWSSSGFGFGATRSPFSPSTLGETPVQPLCDAWSRATVWRCSFVCVCVCVCLQNDGGGGGGWRMLRGRIRMHTCRVVLVTSLVWLLLDVAVLVYYSDPTPTASVAPGGIYNNNNNNNENGNRNDFDSGRGRDPPRPVDPVGVVTPQSTTPSKKKRKKRPDSGGGRDPTTRWRHRGRDPPVGDRFRRGPWPPEPVPRWVRDPPVSHPSKKEIPAGVATPTTHTPNGVVTHRLKKERFRKGSRPPTTRTPIGVATHQSAVP